MINEDHFVLLVTRKLVGVATPAEIAELDALLEQSPVWKEKYHHLRHYFEDPLQVSAENTEQALQLTLNKIKSPQPANVHPIGSAKSGRWKWIAAVTAAAVLIPVGVFLFITANNQTTDAPRQQWVKRSNGKAIRSFIELGDGSKIWLNAESVVTYPEKFRGNSREIFLEGEAFFDVASNARRPFVIHLKNGTIKVLGTSFNIRAYANEPVQTAVVTGKVAFIPRYEDNKKIGDTIFITPDVKVSYTASSGTLIKGNTIGSEDKAWTEGRLIFRNATLEEIGASLERNFNKRVEFEANAPKQFRLTGSFHNNSLEDIMYYLSKSKAFHYRITDSTLVIGE
ncbi:FecR domain-containing protein [Chitinophaga sp. sic0106]|uniref:FecR domain-containing protein n=1 Tax=Chitinophaga sp. sic0106 TaxID=2854785 RepID=UPI001C460212|nr:FecR domain-containing protein [Chitinophaga sp. sic0106]MBV7530613.1 FecR domain-containing protein [Chitinophaga sp. sic0106]